MKKLKLIGKGLFTKCYRLDRYNVVLDSVDPVKECMAMGWFSESTIFPVLDYVDPLDNDSLIKCKYYPRVSSLKKSLKPKQYAIYKELRNLKFDPVKIEYERADSLRKAFKTIKNKRFRDGLLEAVDGVQGYGSDICFDISPRNVAVNKGNLILLDCFFLYSKAEQVRTSKRKYQY